MTELNKNKNNNNNNSSSSNSNNNNNNNNNNNIVKISHFIKKFLENKKIKLYICAR